MKGSYGLWLAFLCFSTAGIGQLRETSIGISTGISCISNYDQLINPYTYSGVTPWTVQFSSELKRGKNLWLLSGSATGQQLHLQSDVSKLFIENHVNFQNYKLSCSYLRSLPGQSFSVQWSFGGTYSLDFNWQEEHYQSLLVESAKGYRKSYLLSPVNIAITGIGEYAINSRHKVRLLASYGFLTIIARPTDNYVKQLGLAGSGSEWDLLAGRKHIAYQLETQYAYLITSHVRFIVSLQTGYRYDNYEDKFAYRMNTACLGIVKLF